MPLAARRAPAEHLVVEMRVVLQPGADADAEEVERLRRQLGSELRLLDIDGVRPVSSGEAPRGTKGGGADVTEWLVTLSASGGVFATLVATVKDWLGRRAAAHRVTLTLDGDTLEVSSATPAGQGRTNHNF